MDCKATVTLGEFSRRGLTRGDNQACDHDFSDQGKYHPCGIVDEDNGQWAITFGSSFKTSDFIVDTLNAWWSGLSAQEQTATAVIQIKLDNGPESSGVRTQFLNRMVHFADHIGKPIQLLYYPPYPEPSTISLSAAGVSWNCTGMGPNSSMSKPCSGGRRV